MSEHKKRFRPEMPRLTTFGLFAIMWVLFSGLMIFLMIGAGYSQGLIPIGVHLNAEQCKALPFYQESIKADYFVRAFGEDLGIQINDYQQFVQLGLHPIFYGTITRGALWVPPTLAYYGFIGNSTLAYYDCGV